MCRIGSIKSKVPVCPADVFTLMIPQQEGYDNSGFAFVMQDMDGVFRHYKDKPLLSAACTKKGAQLIAKYMDAHHFTEVNQWMPRVCPQAGLDIQAMPYYIFGIMSIRNFIKISRGRYGSSFCWISGSGLRALLTRENEGYVYSFWPDVLTLKEIGDPQDIASYFRLWDDRESLQARNIVAQCRQNTNYDIVRYAAHPFFFRDLLCALTEKILSLPKIKKNCRLCIRDI